MNVLSPPAAATIALLTMATFAGCKPASPESAAELEAPAAVYASPQVSRESPAPGLYELAYSDRHNVLFVASSGGFGENAAPSKLLRLDPETLAVQQEIELPLRGFALALDDAGDRLYVGHTLDTSISVIDTTSNELLGTVQLEPPAVGEDGEPARPRHIRQLVVDPGNHRVYAAALAFEGSTLFAVDTRTLAVEKRIDGFGGVATGMVLDPDGGRLFVSNFDGEIVTVDTGSLEVANRYHSGADQPLNLAYDAVGERLFATDQGLEQIRQRRIDANPDYQSRHPGNRVIVIDPDDGRELASLDTGEGPVTLLLDPQQPRLYVTNRVAGTVTVFDSDAYTLLDTVELPAHPNSLAYDPQRRVLYVSVKNGRDAERGSAESVARLAF